MSIARVPAPVRNRHAIVDYLAFSLLFASVSIAVAVALGGIVLLLAPSAEQGGSAESTGASPAQFVAVDNVRQVKGE